MVEELPLFSDSLVETENTDTLNHFSYAQVISRVIQETNTKDSLNIGIFGPWGIGKSSIMSMVQSLLPDEYCSVNINAWRLGGSPESLRRAIVIESRRKIGIASNDLDEVELYNIRHEQKDLISDTLTKALNWFRRHWWKVVLLTVALVLLVKLLIPDEARAAWLASIPSLIALIPIAVLGSILRFLLSTLSEMKVVHIREPISSVEQFSEVFDGLVAYAKSKEMRLVYFLDDVDRLSAEQLVDTLRTVKAFFDRPGCTFVIACHDRLLTEAVTLQLEKDARDQDSTDMHMAQKVRDYIDKIFQVKVYVNPTSESDTVGYARQLITDAQLHLDDLDNVLIALIHSDITTPRQVKRQLNDFLIALRSASLRARGVVKDINDQRMTESASKVLADTAMLAKLVTIRATWPVVYERLFQRPDLLGTLTNAATVGTLEATISQIGLAGLSPRDVTKLQGYLVRTRHIRNPDLVSFLYLRPSDAAIRLGVGERTRDIINAAENGDVQTIKMLLRDFESGELDAWLDYFLDYIGHADPALRQNLLLSTSVILAIVDDGILEERAERLTSDFVSLLSEDVIYESVPDGIVRALVNQVESYPNIITIWLEQNLLSDESLVYEVGRRYFLALLRNWSKLSRINDGNLSTSLRERLHSIASTDVENWSDFVSFCVAELDEDDAPDVRSKLVELTLDAGDPNSETWAQYEEAILWTWPPNEPTHVTWEIFLEKLKSGLDDNVGVENLSSLGWRYASTLCERPINVEVERRVVGLLLREEQIRRLFRENDLDVFISLNDKFAAHAPVKFGRLLVHLIAQESDFEMTITSVVERFVRDSDGSLTGPVIGAMLSQAESILTELNHSGERLVGKTADALYKLVDAVSAFAPGQVSKVIVSDLNSAASKIRNMENLSSNERIDLYGRIATPLLSRLVDLLDRYPEETSQSISNLSYYTSSSDYQAFLAIRTRQESRLHRKLGNHYTIIRSMHHSLEGAIRGVLEMLYHKSWSTEEWAKLLAGFVSAYAVQPGLLDDIKEHHGIDVLVELREIFGTIRAVVGKLVSANPDMLPTIDAMIEGLRGFKKGAVEGLCKELERSCQRNDAATLEEVAAYLKPLIQLNDRKINDRIFQAWHKILVSKQAGAFFSFVTFYESRQNLEGNLGRLDNLLRQLIQDIKTSSMPGAAELIEAIEQVASTFERSSIEAALSRVRDSLATDRSADIR